MAFISSNIFRTETAIFLAENETLLVAEGVTVASADRTAIHGGDGGNVVVIQGTVFAANHGLYLQSDDSDDAEFNVTITATGSVISGTLIGMEITNLWTGSTVTNAGLIQGKFGVIVWGHESVLNNSGSIVSTDGTGVGLTGSGHELTNSGRIEASGKIAVAVAMGGNSESGPSWLVNTGVISATGGKAVGGAGSVENVRNHGAMIGDVNLSGGNDFLQNSGLIDGDVDLGFGSDRMDNRGGTVTGNVHAGEGADIVHGGGGEDAFYGDGGLDRLLGRDGDDQLNGGEGTDWLTGGRDDDRLAGGAGSDRFVFGRNAGHDTIVDFANGSDRIDITRFGLHNAGVNALIAGATYAGTSEVLIDFATIGGNGTLVVQGMTRTELDIGDFLF